MLSKHQYLIVFTLLEISNLRLAQHTVMLLLKLTEDFLGSNIPPVAMLLMIPHQLEFLVLAFQEVVTSEREPLSKYPAWCVVCPAFGSCHKSPRLKYIIGNRLREIGTF